MYKKMWSLLVLVVSFITNAEIQNGKVVAGALAVRNMSRRAVKINGYTIPGDKTLYIDFKSKKACMNPFWGQIKGKASGHNFTEDEFDFLCNEDGTFILETASGGKIFIEVPAVDCGKQYEEYGSGFNMRHIFGCDLRMEPLEFDVFIESHWLFGQKVFVGTRFKQARDNLKQ